VHRPRVASSAPAAGRQRGRRQLKPAVSAPRARKPHKLSAVARGLARLERENKLAGYLREEAAHMNTAMVRSEHDTTRRNTAHHSRPRRSTKKPKTPTMIANECTPAIIVDKPGKGSTTNHTHRTPAAPQGGFYAGNAMLFRKKLDVHWDFPSRTAKRVPASTSHTRSVLSRATAQARPESHYPE